MNRSIAESLEGIRPICEAALHNGIRVRDTIFASFGCALEGDVPPGQVIRIACPLRDLGAYDDFDPFYHQSNAVLLRTSYTGSKKHVASRHEEAIMYGTIARMRIKPGAEAKFKDAMREDEQAKIPGARAVYVYRLDKSSDEYFVAVVFDSKETYVANANKPEQDQRYRHMRELLVSDPEWHDGEIVYSFLQ